MNRKRLVQAGLVTLALLCLACYSEEISPGTLGLLEVGLGVLFPLLALVFQPRLSVSLALAAGYAIVLILLQSPPFQSGQIADLLALAFITASLFWIIWAAIFLRGWGCLIESGRVVLSGLALLVVLPLLFQLDTITDFPAWFPWVVSPAWPSWKGMLILLLVPLVIGIPAGMAVMRIRRGRTPVLGCLAFLALFPRGELFSLTAGPLFPLISSFAFCMLAGSALSNRFSPHVLASARLSGASRLELVYRLYLPAAGWITFWIALVVLWLALDIRERSDLGAGFWTLVLRMLPLVVLLLYLFYGIPARLSKTGQESERRMD